MIFAADVVLTVVSGRHVTADFGDVHRLMDHLYPGIMTLGVAAMQPTASAELLRQFPQFQAVPPFVVPWEDWRSRVLGQLQAEFDVQGPHRVDESVVAKAFEKFGGP